jgi:hypothetical protein
VEQNRGWRPRTDVDVVADQLSAIDAFNRARAATEQAAHATQLTREMRMDNSRRLEVVRRQHRSLVARADEQLRQSSGLLYSSADRRAVVAHANDWFSKKLAGRLEEEGVRVLARVPCGADAVGVAVAEQVDVILVGEKLEMVSGEEVVREVTALAPHTLLAAQVPSAQRAPALLEAGASEIFTREVPPGDVAGRLAELVAG